LVVTLLDCELDLEQFELRRAGERVRVEPRVLEVLIYLARNPERVVTKDELIEQVWRRRFVSEAALTRCITEARRALGVAGGGESPIRTIHGRGYRLVLSPPAPPPDVASTPTSSGEAQSADLPSQSGETRVLWRLHPVSAIALAATLVAVAVVAARARWLAPGGAPGREAAALVGPGRHIRLALLPITADPLQGELRLVGLSISDALRSRLSAVADLEVRGPEYPGADTREATSLGQLARESGASFLIGGRLVHDGVAPRAQLELVLYDARSPEAVIGVTPWRFDVPLLTPTTDLAELTTVREQIASKVVRSLSPATQASAPPALRPRSVEAHRLYLLAFDRITEITCLGGGATELLDRSLALDALYAPAWELRAWAEYNRVWACGESAAHYASASEAADRSLALFPGNPRLIGLATSLLVEQGRLEEAWARLLEAEQRFPENLDLLMLRVYVLNYAGYLENAAETLERVLAEDPTLLAARGWTPNTYLYHGSPEAFLDALPGLDAPLFRYYRALAEFRLGRTQEARALLEPCFRMNPSDIFARLAHAFLAVLDGRLRDARAVLDQIALQRAHLGSLDGEMTYKIAQLYALVGEPDAAASQLRLAVAQGFFCVDCFASDPLLTPLRDHPEAQAALAEAGERHRTFGRRFGLVPAG